MRFEQLGGEYRLGLDLGVGSVGWAVIREESGKPCEVVAAGSRVFPAGVDEIERGAGVPRGEARRLARGRRRLLQRRVQRRRTLFRMLVEQDLLPLPSLGATDASPEARHEALTAAYEQALDYLAQNHGIPREVAAGKATHLLREIGLSTILPRPLIGLVLYALSARRGFQSNARERNAATPPAAPGEAPKTKRKGAKAPEAPADTGTETSAAAKEKSQLLKAIADLSREVRESGSPTLGAFLAKVDPHVARIRTRKLSRSDVRAEFEALCHAQHLPRSVARPLRTVAFHQRPLKSTAKLVGECEFEQGKRRAPLALPSAQWFRLLARVLDLRVVGRDGDPVAPAARLGLFPEAPSRMERNGTRRLSDAERRALIGLLKKNATCSMKEAKAVLQLRPGESLNFDEESATRLIGDRTCAWLDRYLGPQWAAMPIEDRDVLVQTLLAFREDAPRARYLRKRFDLSAADALNAAEAPFEEGHLRLSRVAIGKLLPHMEGGRSYGEARTLVYGNRLGGGEPVARLVPVSVYKPSLRNPVVTRTLSELRKVMNELVAIFGLPRQIRVELAREVKLSPKERVKVQLDQREREKRRNRALKVIEAHRPDAKRPWSMVERVILWEECNHTCPYTGHSIGAVELLAEDSPVDVEHVIPYSRCFDDSLGNKTLCWAEENRNVKRNRAPSECYTPERLEEMLSRIDGWRAPLRVRAAMKRRFQLAGEELAKALDRFAERQLNDTRYASLEARDFLGTLYGGAVSGGTVRVAVGGGRLTSILRDAWGLAAAMPDVRSKRDDHRHHALDAICVAMSEQSLVQQLAVASSRSWGRGERRTRVFAQPPLPFDGFVDQVRGVLDAVVVSHKVSMSCTGPLHEETHYGGKPGAEVVRKRVEALSSNELVRIVDATALRSVTSALEGGDPKQVFRAGAEAAWPRLRTATGKTFTVKRVRVGSRQSGVWVGTGVRKRLVSLKANSHIEMFTDEKARMQFRVVSRLDVYERKFRRGLPRVDKSAPPGGRFLYALFPGEVVRTKHGLYRLTQMSEGDLVFTSVRDARLAGEIKADRTAKVPPMLRLASAGALASVDIVRVRVDSVGRVLDV